MILLTNMMTKTIDLASQYQDVKVDIEYITPEKAQAYLSLNLS